jgi:hypothetical protein
LTMQTCENCGRLFSYSVFGLCDECARQMDRDYVKVRRYIYQNPDKANFKAIVENAEVSEKALNYLIDKGRIVLRGGGVKSKTNKCRACAGPTDGDVLCQRCKQKLIEQKLMPGADKGADKKAETAAKTPGPRVQPLTSYTKR